MTSGNNGVSNVALQTNTAAAACSRGQGQHVGNVAFPLPRGQRQGDAFAADLEVAAVSENILQGPIDLRIAGNQPAADRAQKIVSAENPSAGGVGMDYSAVGLDQEHPGAQAIEDVDQGRRFVGFLVDCLTDEDRTTRVRCDK